MNQTKYSFVFFKRLSKLHFFHLFPSREIYDKKFIAITAQPVYTIKPQIIFTKRIIENESHKIQFCDELNIV